jgi:hypothetical protein
MIKINLSNFILKVSNLQNLKYTVCLFSLIFTSTVFASHIVNTHTQNTISQGTLVISTQSLAKDWGLTEVEWIQYVTLMKGYSGHYYQKLSPTEVLGINAETDEDMRHFAEIAAKQEHDKLERELKFNVAFHEAATRLYSGEQIIKPFDLTAFTPIK